MCLWIVRFQQAPGTGFPRRHAAPSAQSDYRSLSGVHIKRAIAPAAAAFQNMHDAADDAAVVRPLDAPYIRRQMRSIRPHCSSLSQNRFLRTIPIPFQQQIRIVLSERKN